MIATIILILAVSILILIGSALFWMVVISAFLHWATQGRESFFDMFKDWWLKELDFRVRLL